MMIRNSAQKGFTLIELLVVIAIIGTLASVVLASLNHSRAKARDAERLAELRQLANALQLYYTDHNIYPTQLPDGSRPNTATLTAVENIDGLTPQYIPTIPYDPKPDSNTDGYRYHHATDQKSYTLLVQLETDTDSDWCRPPAQGVGYSGWTGFAACDL